MRYYRNGQRLDENNYTDNYDEARRLLKQREGEISDGRTVSPTANRLRFEDAAEDLETEYPSTSGRGSTRSNGG